MPNKLLYQTIRPLKCFLYFMDDYFEFFSALQNEIDYKKEKPIQ